MLKIYLLTSFRHLLKNRKITAVNLIGLTTGIASIMTLFMLIFQRETANRNFPNLDRMYYLKTETTDGGHFLETPYPLLGEIVSKCPEVEAATHIQQWYYPWIEFKGKQLQEKTEFADTGFFDVFRFSFRYGSPTNALRDKYSIVLSQELAASLFGGGNPVGKVVLADDTLHLTVTGVLNHIPTNASVRPNIILPIRLLADNRYFSDAADWTNGFARNYILLKTGASPSLLNRDVAGIVNRNYTAENKDKRVIPVPFEQITEEDGTLVGSIVKGSVAAGIFILLIVFLNLVNLNTATVFSRTRESAIRRVIGATRRTIILQFCFENGLLLSVSILLAWLLFAFLLLPGVGGLLKDSFGEVSAGLSINYLFLLSMAAIGLVFAIAAASLPAWKLLSVKVTDAMKTKAFYTDQTKSPWQRLMITVQFIMALVLICVSIILSCQMHFMKNAALGFNKDQVVVINLNMAFYNPSTAASSFEKVLNELRSNPHVRSFSTNNVIPTSYADYFNTYTDPATNKEVHFREGTADAGYLPTYQIALSQGASFDDRLDATEANAVLINRAAVKILGWQNPIGRQLKRKGGSEVFTVIGVTEDFHYRDLGNPIEPLIHTYSGKQSLNNNYLSVRTDDDGLMAVTRQLETAFRSIPSRRAFSYQLMSDRVSNQYALLDGTLKITNYIAVLTIIISCMGMYGLVSLLTKYRTREIGIRKVLGAGTATITWLLLRRFVVIIGLAIVVAIPISFSTMRNWLNGFAYHIRIQWWMFGLAVAFAVAAIAITIGSQTMKAALANPIKSLKDDN